MTGAGRPFGAAAVGGGSHAAEEDSSGAGAAADAVVAPAAERELVRRAVGGDRDAVTEVVRLLQDSLYRLALRMLARPADAEDATQEILVRVLGHLGTWRGEAALLTWAYRIGVNYLLNLARRTPLERAQLSLDAFGDGLRDGLATADYRGPEAELLTREMRLSCSQAMLQCLARDERVAFVLSEVFDLGSTEAAWIVGSTPAAHRKRLERAKRRLGSFLDSTCGLANPTAFCRCARRIDKAVAIGRLDPAHPVLATHPVTPGGRTAAAAEQQMIRLHDAAAVLRSHPDYAAPQARMAAIAGLLSSDRFPLLAAADLTTGRAGSVLENGGTEREAGVS